MQRRTVLAATSLIVLGAAAAARSHAVAAEAEITIDDFAFSPNQLTVAAGTRVTWTNRDDSPHTVIDRDNPRTMRSPPLDTGDQFAFAFEHPGTYRYFCSLHPHMQGTVLVQ